MRATIEPLAGRPGRYRVCTGGGAYEVDAATGECQCPHYQHRLRGQVGATCKHGQALADYLDELSACPCCQGRGVHVPRLRYAGGQAPLVCCLCDGSGRRETIDPGLLAGYRRREAEERDAELRQLFA